MATPRAYERLKNWATRLPTQGVTNFVGDATADLGRNVVNLGQGAWTSGSQWAGDAASAAWENPWVKGGVYGGAALLGHRAIAYPLYSGALLSPEMREGIGMNPIGSFLTGQDANDPRLQRQLVSQQLEEERQRAQQQSLAEQARLEEAYRNRQMYDMGNAMRMQGLQSSREGVAQLRGLYASQLKDTVGNYLAAMSMANNAVNNILAAGG